MSASQPQAVPSDQTDRDTIVEQTGADAPAGFDQFQWDESRADEGPASPGGRKVLGSALILLAIAWTAYTAWSAGRALAAEPLNSPAFAQWVAIAAGPLALLGLVWLMFGRTRRKESEKFTRSVVAMRTEAHSLEVLLGVLSQRISDSRSELTAVSESLMRLGDEATGKLGGITSEFDQSTLKLRQHGEILDRAAESARTDIAVLLDDLPRAQEQARSISEQLRDATGETLDRTAEFDRQVAALSERAREADSIVSEAANRLVSQLQAIELAGREAAGKVGEAETGFSATVEALLDQTSLALGQIREGVDAQAEAVTALVEQASAGIGRSSADSAEALARNVETANSALETLGARVAEQDEASQRMAAQIAEAVGELERKFSAIAEAGDQHSARLVEALSQSRFELEALGQQSDFQNQSLDALAERTESLQSAVERLTGSVRAQLSQSLEQAAGQTDQLLNATRAVRPEIEWVRDAAVEASDRLGETGNAIAGQQDSLTALLATLDEGSGEAESRLNALSAAIAEAQAQAAELSAETGPALVQAMVQVREAAAHAADRAREAIASVVPESAESFSDATREALEGVIRDSIQERLRDVEVIAAKAVDSARAATDRLTHQMLVLGQSATALEEHLERQHEERREADSETFARRVSLLIDSMHSASIDVGKILADEVDEKAWESYLKGDRGVFTRRAARLLAGSETKAIRSYYESDGEFQQSANRFIHDFEAMLRRVLADRDGGMIAVTLMSSDMGKLYAALADALERRR